MGQPAPSIQDIISALEGIASSHKESIDNFILKSQRLHCSIETRKLSKQRYKHPFPQLASRVQLWLIDSARDLTFEKGVLDSLSYIAELLDHQVNEPDTNLKVETVTSLPHQIDSEEDKDVILVGKADPPSQDSSPSSSKEEAGVAVEPIVTVLQEQPVPGVQRIIYNSTVLVEPLGPRKTPRKIANNQL